MMKQRLEQLSFNKQLLFGVCLTERMMHFYKEFDEVWEESFSELANIALEEIYENIERNSFSVYENFSRKVAAIIPDSDEYEDQEAVFAQNAGISLLNCIEFTKSNKLSLILECISKIEETLDVREIVVYNNSEVESNKAIKQEHDIQIEIFNMLIEFPKIITKNEINKIRTFAKENIIKVYYEY